MKAINVLKQLGGAEKSFYLCTWTEDLYQIITQQIKLF